MIPPLISIVIPCYNHGIYIDEAIKSVEEYKNNDYEIIIINDGSTDSFTNIRLEELKSKGYNVIFQTNQGLGKTRNNGIKIAKGKYILPLDSDNKIKPEFIIKAIDVLENNSSISIVYSDKHIFGNYNDLIKVGEFNLSFLLNENYIDACAIFRKKVWNDIGGYDETMILGWEDWDFWLSAIEKDFLFYYIPEPLYYYRVLENSMIRQLISNPNISSLLNYIYKKHISLLLKEYRRVNSELNNNLELREYENQHPFRTSLKFIKRWILNIKKIN